MKNVGNRIARGAVWMVLFKVIERSLGLISTIILARLLVPNDFGIVAMATSIIYALDLLNSFSFELALIQKRSTREVDYNTAWTFRILLSFVVAGTLALLAGPAANFYGQPDLPPVILVLAIGVVAESFQNIGTVMYLKEMNFRKEFILRALVKIIAFSTTVPLAFYLRDYWALVIGMVVGRLATVVLSYMLHPYRPKLSIAAWRELFGFSIWLFLNNVNMFLRLRLADFVIGRSVGAAQLGLFSVAYEIAHLVSSELIAPINRAVFPGFSQIASDRARLRQQLLNVLAVTCLLSLPAALGVAAIADLVVPILLGPSWLETIPLIRLLALHGTYVGIVATITSVYLAIGRPQIPTLVGAVYVVVLLSLLLYLTPERGPLGAAYACLLSALLMTPVVLVVLMRVLALSLGQIVATFWRPLTAATVMYLAVREVVLALGTGESFLETLMTMALCIVLGGTVYLAAISLLWLVCAKPDGAERIISELLVRRLRRWAILSDSRPSGPSTPRGATSEGPTFETGRR